MAVKEDLIKALQDLPDDATEEEVADRVYFVLVLKRRIEEMDAGVKVSDAEARERLKRWLK